MSEPVENTAAGATKGFFGSLAFILLMVGVEGMTGAAELPPGLGPMLIVVGGACAYAAFFWESATKVLSVDAQDAIGRFAQSRITWFGMLSLCLLAIILSPFIEQRRWPFSYPSDPAVYAENARLKTALQNAQSDAAKWRFSHNLRNGAIASNGERLECKFFLALSPNTGPAWNVWQALQPMLDLARWQAIPEDVQTRGLQLPHGITISVGVDAGSAFSCGTALSRVASDSFPSQNVTLKTNQVTAALVACKNECVELDIGD
jgi:hypothetical protein